MDANCQASILSIKKQNLIENDALPSKKEKKDKRKDARHGGKQTEITTTIVSFFVEVHQHQRRSR